MYTILYIFRYSKTLRFLPGPPASVQANYDDDDDDDDDDDEAGMVTCSMDVRNSISPVRALKRNPSCSIVVNHSILNDIPSIWAWLIVP